MKKAPLKSKNDPIQNRFQMKQLPVKKSVCCRKIQQQQYYFETQSKIRCIDCSVNNRQHVICSQCFNGSVHINHKIQLVFTQEVFCDCGNEELLKNSCSKHKNQINQIQLQQKVMKKGRNIIEDFFFKFFSEKQKKNWIQLFKLNKNNPGWNVITSIYLCQKFRFFQDQTRNVNSNLWNLFKWDISRQDKDDQNLTKWMQLFNTLYNHKPFRMQFLRSFIENFQSLATTNYHQTNTFYYVVQKYLKDKDLMLQYLGQQNVKGFGQHQKFWGQDDQLKIYNYFSSLSKIIDYLIDLQAPVSLAYWKMHMKLGCDNIISYLKYSYDKRLQKKMIKSYIGILRVLKNQKQYLKGLLKFFVLEYLKYTNSDHQIFYPFAYERYITLTFFCLQKCILKQQFNQASDIETKILVTKNIFTQIFDGIPKNTNKSINKLQYLYQFIVKKMFSSLFSEQQPINASRSRCQKYLDVLCFKIFISVVKDDLFSELFSQKIRLFIKSFGLDLDSKHNQYLFDQLKPIQRILDGAVKLYKDVIPQIYFNFQMDLNVKEYDERLYKIITEYFYRNQGYVNQQKMIQFKQTLCSKNNPKIDRWIDQNCQVKRYILCNYDFDQIKKPIKIPDILGFMIHFLLKQPLQRNPLHNDDIIETQAKNIVQNEQNMNIFHKIWHKNKIMEQLNQVLIKISCGPHLHRLKYYEIFIQVYLVKKANNLQQQSQLIKENIIKKSQSKFQIIKKRIMDVLEKKLPEDKTPSEYLALNQLKCRNQINENNYILMRNCMKEKIQKKQKNQSQKQQSIKESSGGNLSQIDKQIQFIRKNNLLYQQDIQIYKNACKVFDNLPKTYLQFTAGKICKLCNSISLQKTAFICLLCGQVICGACDWKLKPPLSQRHRDEHLKKQPDVIFFYNYIQENAIKFFDPLYRIYINLNGNHKYPIDQIMKDGLRHYCARKPLSKQSISLQE